MIIEKIKDIRDRLERLERNIDLILKNKSKKTFKEYPNKMVTNINNK